MTQASPKGKLFHYFSRVARALGHAHRLEILEALAQTERSVDAIAKYAHLSVANASQHLQILRQAGLVTSRKVGKHVYYRLSGPDVVNLISALHRTAERHMGEANQVIRRYYDRRDSLEPVSRQELLERLEEGSVTLLDVRPPEEFAAGHIPGALNIPASELERHLEALPKDREVVAYCRGAWCILSFDAVALLRKKGLVARRLEDGYPEWEAEGHPVQSQV